MDVAREFETAAEPRVCGRGITRGRMSLTKSPISKALLEPQTTTVTFLEGLLTDPAGLVKLALRQEYLAKCDLCVGLALAFTAGRTLQCFINDPPSVLD